MENVADEMLLIVCTDLDEFRGKNPALFLGLRCRSDNLRHCVDGGKRRQDQLDRYSVADSEFAGGRETHSPSAQIDIRQLRHDDT